MLLLFLLLFKEFFYYSKRCIICIIIYYFIDYDKALSYTVTEPITKTMGLTETLIFIAQHVTIVNTLSPPFRHSWMYSANLSSGLEMWLLRWGPFVSIGDNVLVSFYTEPELSLSKGSGSQIISLLLCLYCEQALFCGNLDSVGLPQLVLLLLFGSHTVSRL